MSVECVFGKNRERVRARDKFVVCLTCKTKTGTRENRASERLQRKDRSK
jgi:hypothetical protein